MELKRYLIVIRRWKWLLILGLILGTAGGYIGSLIMPPVFEASTKVMVTQSSQSQTSDITGYINNQQLTETYLQLVKTKVVMETAYKKLGFDINPDTLGAGITANSIVNTQLILITVEDTSPLKAQLIANTLVSVLIEQNDAIQLGRYSSMEESLQAQKTQMDTQITDLQSQIDQLSTKTIAEQQKWMEDQISSLQGESATLQQDITNTTPITPELQNLLDEKKTRLAQIESLLSLYQKSYYDLVVNGQLAEGAGSTANTQLSLMRTTLTLYQQIYLSILNSLETVRLARLQNTPNVVQIEPATLPDTPVRPRKLMNSGLAGILGLMVAVGGVFLKEYFDDTLKTLEEVETILGVPVIGSIWQIDYDNGTEGLYVAQNPRSPISEAFRLLRTNLEFINPLHTVLITSPGPNEGKSTVSANLAAIISQGSKRVILLDADLRKPQIHRLLGLTNSTGFSEIFRGKLTSIQTVIQPVENSKNMSVITSGSLPPNPAELLGSNIMALFLENIKKQTDIVVIDSPPSLVSDSQILASKVDGIILVIRPGLTKINAARETIEQMKRAGGKLIGIVINGVPKEHGYYYGRQNYYSSQKGYPYYSEESKEKSKSK